MQAQFGNVTMTQHPARLRVTNPDDVFLALTCPILPAILQIRCSLPHFTEAFRVGNGALEVGKESGLFISRKAA